LWEALNAFGRIDMNYTKAGKIMNNIKMFTIKIYSLFTSILFILQNILYCWKIKPIPRRTLGEFVYYGLKPQDISDMLRLYSCLNNGKKLDWQKIMLYRIYGSKIVITVKLKDVNELIAVEMYYFNNRDTKEGTIHQGFRGVKKDWQGKGIGTKVTMYAIEHFKNNSIKGLSSRVSLNNLPSLISNQKVGFKPIEKYYDPDRKEDRYYLINYFDK
jgi:RimJ/RimL family protein N-acetyltransferase